MKCPITGEECTREECAWWVEEAGACAVVAALKAKAEAERWAEELKKRLVREAIPRELKEGLRPEA